MYQQRPPKRRRLHGGRLVLVIVLTLTFLVVICVAGFGGFLYFVLSNASEAPRAATHAFVAELAESDADGAYDKLCNSVRARYTREQFSDYVETQPPVTAAKVNGFDIENDDAEIRTTLTLRDGGSRGHTFRLVNENGGWKVCGDPY